MPSGLEWLVILTLLTVAFFAALWFVVRSAVRAGARSADQQDRRGTSAR